MGELALPLLLGLGAFFVLWYLLGNELMRRRARRLALWCKRATDPLGGAQTIQWLTLQSFRLEVQGPEAPFASVALVGLTESWDVPMIWLWNRLRGRRDLVLAQAALRRPPRWGLELYRPRGLLAGDARHLARREGWDDAPEGELRLAAVGGPPRELARRLLAELGAERARLVRLAVRRRDVQLSLALDLPDPARLDPARFCDLLRRLAREASREE